jgi:hypothetical protein
MPSLRNQTDRNRLIQRLNSLTPASKPLWGKLDAQRMVCHLGDALAMALGELAVQPTQRGAFQHFPLKHLVLYVLPFPKSVPTAPELLSSAPGDFEADRQRAIEAIHRVGGAPAGMGPAHPFFGPLNQEEWSALQAKHIAHHLKQFGV